jgi:hypothetical protein
MPILLCGVFSFVCYGITYMADPWYKKVVFSGLALAFQVWRYMWRDYTFSLLLFETCLSLCRVWMGGGSKDTPLWQFLLFCFAFFNFEPSAQFFSQQALAYKTEFHLFLGGMACEALWTLCRKPDTNTERRAVREEAMRRPTEDKPPFELLTPSVKMYQVCGVWLNE